MDTLDTNTQQQAPGFYTGYPDGNMEQVHQLITVNIPKAWQLIMKTIDPIIYAAMIRLTGSNSRFDKVSGSATLGSDQSGTVDSIQVMVTFSVPDYIGFNGDPSMIQDDKNFLLQQCQQVTTVQWDNNSVAIEPGRGLVTIKYSVEV